MRRLDLAAERIKEDWLQRALFTNPHLLRAGEVDAAFADARPICMELLCDGGDGYRAIDIFCLTPLGNIVVVEVKLGTNGEARRAIVAQALEYAGCLRRLGAEGIARRVRGPSLYDQAGAASAGLDPDEFAAAVDANLRRGRLLLLMALDKAGPALRGLVEDLRNLPSLPFEIGLLEAACFADPSHPDEILVVSRMAHTLRAIERPVVPPCFDDVRPRRPKASPVKSTSRPLPLLEAEFYETLEKNMPREAAWLRAFVEQLAGLGVRPHVVRTMMLKADITDATTAGLGSIGLAGEVPIYPATAAVLAIPGGEAAVHAYLLDIAALIAGEAITSGPPTSWRVLKDGRHPRISDFLGKEAGWAAGMERFLAALRDFEPTERGRTESSHPQNATSEDSKIVE